MTLNKLSIDRKRRTDTSRGDSTEEVQTLCLGKAKLYKMPLCHNTDWNDSCLLFPLNNQCHIAYSLHIPTYIRLSQNILSS